MSSFTDQNGDNAYSRRELDHFLKDIKEHLTKQDVKLESILTQTTKTNGRVSALEYWRSALVWCFGVLLTITIFLLNKFI